MTSKAKIAVGDRVHYTAMFLRSTGQVAGEAGFRKGTVTELKDIGNFGFAKVDWNDGHSGMVSCFNICRVGSSASYAS